MYQYGDKVKRFGDAARALVVDVYAPDPQRDPVVRYSLHVEGLGLPMRSYQEHELVAGWDE